MNLLGLYGGLVEDNRDPEKLGRLKVRVPHIFGVTGSVFGAVTTNDLPWALPKGLPSGLTQQSGGADWLPEIGDPVWVMFLDGEPEKPVWEWGMQTQAAAGKFALYNYDTASDGSVSGLKRGAWVRYGHTVEWNEDGLILTTSKGYRLLITDASDAGNDGDITLETQAGQSFDFDDSTGDLTLNVTEDWNINVGQKIFGMANSISLNTLNQDIELVSGDKLSIETQSDFDGTVGDAWSMDVTGASTFTLQDDWSVTASKDIQFTVTEDLTFDVTGNVSLTSEGNTSLSSSSAMTIASSASLQMKFSELLIGQGAASPFVLGDQLFQYLEQLFTILVTHTHAGVTSGSGSTGPMIPPPPPPTASLLSQSILGK